MQMATISRWTLLYFSCALAALVTALGLMALGLGYPFEAMMAPPTCDTLKTSRPLSLRVITTRDIA